VKISDAWNRFWFTPAWAEDLAVSRNLFAGGLFLLSVSRPIYEWGDLPTAYLRPASFFQTFGVPIGSSDALYVIQIGWRAAIVALTVGLLTRTSAALAALGSLYLLGIDAPEFLGRSYTPAVFVPAILACSRCGDVWSVDAWRRRRHCRAGTGVQTSDEYGWPIKMVCAFLSYTFLAAGVSKIRQTGFPDWILSDMSYRTLLFGNYWYASRDKALLPVGAALLRISDSSAVVVGGITHLTELLYPLALFAPMARVILVPLMVALLVGIAIAMGPFFGLTILAHVFWVPWSRVLRRMPISVN
jgi:hypothetical protein